MKKYFFLLLCLSLNTSFSQSLLKKLADKAKQRAEAKANQKVDEEIDKTIDKAIDGKKSPKTDTKTKTSNNTESTTENSGAKKSSDNSNNSFNTFSKFDFISGEKVIAVEDFSQDAIGDFPARWNTNGSGEIQTVEGKTGKWLSLPTKGNFLPEFITQLPENFTFEFDVLCNPNFSFYSTALFLNFIKFGSQKEFSEVNEFGVKDNAAVRILFHPQGAGGGNGTAKYYLHNAKGEQTMHNEVEIKQFASKLNKTTMHISIWRQKQRLRVYANEEKIFDLPRAFETGINYNSILFNRAGSHEEGDRYLISNLKLAVGAPDTRHKFIEEGKFTTNGILFDFQSAKVKGESFGVIKSMADVLTENVGVKVKIIGHTSNDGDAAANLALSKSRAQAVKEILVKQFNIDESRITTDGKGGTELIDKANTQEAKANNRRVEFVKL